MIPNSILIYIHAPFYRVGGDIFFDSQAQNGLRLWAENFDRVRIMAPLVEADAAPAGTSALQPFLETQPRVEPVMLPRRGTMKFLTEDRAPGRREIRAQIAAAQYLVFGFSGYLGDWGTLACREAARMGRPYAVFKDLVGYRSVRVYQQRQQRGLPQRLWDGLQNIWMKHSDAQVVRRSSLALLHGRDTLDYYSAFASTPRLVHNIHLSKADRISDADLTARLAQRDPDLLKIAYAGRVEAVKGPEDWISAIGQAHAQGTGLSARWYGTGDMLEAQRAEVAARDLTEQIRFEGFVDHRQMLAQIRACDIFVFTHLTDESPRCLIEALTLGLPLVGYDSAYPRDLVGDRGAGLFVPRGDTAALGEAIHRLARDPERLAAMSQAARASAAPLNDEDVFRERSDIIKETL